MFTDQQDRFLTVAARSENGDPLAPREGLAARGLIFLVLAYRVTLGPFLGGRCRYQPTCSQYMIDAVRRYGPWRGAWRGLKRIARCHPFGGCGYDPA